MAEPVQNCSPQGSKSQISTFTFSKDILAFPHSIWVAGLQDLPVTCAMQAAEEMTCRRNAHCQGRSTFFPATPQANPGRVRQQQEFYIPCIVFAFVCARQGGDVTPAADLHRLPVPHMNEVPLRVWHWATTEDHMHS